MGGWDSRCGGYDDWSWSAVKKAVKEEALGSAAGVEECKWLPRLIGNRPHCRALGGGLGGASLRRVLGAGSPATPREPRRRLHQGGARALPRQGRAVLDAQGPHEGDADGDAEISRMMADGEAEMRQDGMVRRRPFGNGAR